MALLAGLLAGTTLSAQGGPPVQSAQGQVAAPVINLNVVARDAKGQPVTDLTREEFQVFEGSKPQRILSFRRNDGSLKRLMRPAPGERSNREGTPMSRVTVILFDLLNARFEDRAYMLNELTPALQHVEGSDTLFLYILTMNGTLYPVHGLADAGKTRAPDAHPWTDDVKSLLENASRETFRLNPFIDVDSRVRMTYKALATMAERIAAAPGRKGLIWISHGVPISLTPQSTGNFGEVDYTPLLQRLTATLDRAEVAVYTVRQPESMRSSGNDGGMAADLARPGGTGSGIGMASIDTLDQFAALTGGHAFMTPDIRGAIARAALDARMSYVMSFEPPAAGWDGKYHKLRVATPRKGVKLETKQGYYAFADLAAEGDQEKTAVEAAITSAFDATEIGIYAQAAERPQAALSVDLSIRVDAADLHFFDDGPLRSARAAVSVVGYLKDGRTEVFPVDQLLPKLSAEEMDKALREGIHLEKRIVLEEGVQTLRVLVYDRGSGAVGSLTLPVGKK